MRLDNTLLRGLMAMIKPTRRATEVKNGRKPLSLFLLGILLLSTQTALAAAPVISPSSLEASLTKGGEISENFTSNPSAYSWGLTTGSVGNISDTVGAETTYSYPDPGNLEHCDKKTALIFACVYDSSEVLTCSQNTTNNIKITYKDPLELSGTAPPLQGKPGTEVTFEISFSGGKGPYSASSTRNAEVNVDNANKKLTYSYTIASGTTSPSLTDTVTLTGQTTECGGDSATLQVTIEVLPPLAVNPSTLTLTGAPGETKTGTVKISGGTRPYSLEERTYLKGASATLSTDTVTYTINIPNDASPGTQNDKITVIDNEGEKRDVTVQVQVSQTLTVKPQTLQLAGAPGERVTSQVVSISGGKAPYNAQKNLPQASIALSGNSLTYSIDIPQNASGSLSDTIRVTDAAGVQRTVDVKVEVSQSLSVAPQTLSLTGVPGERVTSQVVSISGGKAPYNAQKNLSQANIALSGNSLTYSIEIPQDASGPLSDTITVTDAVGTKKTIPVEVTVLPPLTATPSSVELSVMSQVGVTGEVSREINVSGGLPPYTLQVTGKNSRIEPGQLAGPGSATYTINIPSDSPATTIADKILVSDATGSQFEILVSIAVSASNPLSSRTDLTPNQQSVAIAVETVCPQLHAMKNRTPDQEDLYIQCSTMIRNADSSAIPQTLNEITNEQADAASSAAIQSGTAQFANIGARLGALRSGAKGFSMRGLTINIDGQPVTPDQIASLTGQALRGGAASADDFGRWGVFINGSYNFGKKDATENESGFDYDGGGVTAGVDYRFTDKLIAGGAVGFGKNNASFDADGGGLDTETWHVAAYGTYNWTENIYVDAIMEYGWQTHDSTRNIQYQLASDAVNRQALANYDGSQFGLSVGGGYDVTNGPYTYGLYARAGYLNIDVDDMQETGAQGLNLRMDGFNGTSVTTTVGARLSRAFSTNMAVFVPQIRFEWEHEYDDDAEILTAFFAADPTATAFGIETDDPDRNYFRLGLGVSAVFSKGLSGYLNYDATLGQENWTGNLFDLGVRWEF